MSPPKKLYTKTGDTGTSSTISRKKIRKDHPLFDALGTLDELNSHLGLCASLRKQNPKKELQSIQQNLLKIGAQIAGSKKTTITPYNLKFLEKRLNHYQARTKTLSFNHFLLPGGNPLAARLDIARSVCRRFERHLVSLGKSKHKIPAPKYNLITAYINRLSDYLYSLRCYQNYRTKFQETPFKP